MTKGRLAWRAAVAVSLYHNHRTDTRDHSKSNSLESSEIMFKLFASCLSLLAAVPILFTAGMDYTTILWTSIFFSSPIIHLVIRLLGCNTQACSEARHYIENDHGVDILQFADSIWCLGYAIQFASWVKVAQEITSLPALSGNNAAVTNWVIVGLILAAITVSACCKKRMFKLWSLRNWTWTQINYCLFAGFALLLAANMPDSPQAREIWRQRIFVPHSAFAIVVLEIFAVTLVKDLVSWVARLAVGDAALHVESDEAPEVLRERWNPMLNSTPDRWRSTLMAAFMLCQFTFGVLDYGLLYDGRHTAVPAWLNVL